jgi:acyl carrier protein
MSGTAELVRGFLVENRDWVAPASELADDTPLTAVLDSLAVVNLVLWIEQDLGAELHDGDLEPENFETVARIAALIDSRR